MAATYVHLSGRDIDDAILKLHGLKREEKKEVSENSIKICPKCNELNSPLSHFCKKCGSPFDIQSIIELDETRRKLDEFIFEMLKRIAEKYPDIKKDFKQLIKEKGLDCLFKQSS